jgi:hypothetical protein
MDVEGNLNRVFIVDKIWPLALVTFDVSLQKMWTSSNEERRILWMEKGIFDDFFKQTKKLGFN